MDFRLTTEQEALKREFKEFFQEEAKNTPAGWVGGIEIYSDEVWDWHCSVAKKLGDRGWLSLTWPKKYGGKGLSYIEQALFNEERGYYKVLGVDNFGPTMVAPILLAFSTEEQKQEWLPRIANGPYTWAEGWSEPNAGSDLASLTTRAVADGDEYIINGQKIWTTGAHRADAIFLLARTDPDAPKHKGITCFVFEMNRPGITVKPLLFMHRRHIYNEVFFDDVRVHKRNIVGPLNQGWYVNMAQANYERSMIGEVSGSVRDFEDLMEFCRETGLNKNSLLRHKLAELAIEIETARQWAYQIAWLQSKGQPFYAEAAAGKYFVTELNLRFANTAVEIMGLYGTLKPGSKWATLKGRFEELCQLSAGQTIAGATTETQKNTIAWYGLKLPRIR